MAFIKATDGCQLFVQEMGEGTPVVFIHGWPATSDMFEYQFNALPAQGIRCIAYDRRGFGRSDKPWNGYDYDTLADDLNCVLEQMNLTNVTLVGMSMGSGEVVRYLSRHPGQRVSKAVILSGSVPYMVKSDTNEDGLPRDMFTEMIQKIRDDRPAFLGGWAKMFWNIGLLNKPVSDEMLNMFLMQCYMASGHATQVCVRTFSETDMRAEARTITVPTLILHGEDDKVVPIKISADVLSTLIPHAEYIKYEGAGHGLYYEERDRINADIARFVINGSAINGRTADASTSGELY